MQIDAFAVAFIVIAIVAIALLAAVVIRRGSKRLTLFRGSGPGPMFGGRRRLTPRDARPYDPPTTPMTTDPQAPGPERDEGSRLRATAPERCPS